LAALGVARADDAELLTAAAADLAVTTLGEVDLDRLSEGRLGRR
jgi:beta-phosphoglucomutase